MNQSKSTVEQHPHTLLLDEEGRLTLPESIRQQMSLTEGDHLILTITEEGILQLASLRHQVKKMRGILKNSEPSKSVVDELIRDRRQEVSNE
jgi:bifunctional DNA-binding transcriptional regulator/antitoxin component of YhaV-PrlF toxin-antitoxin module